MAFSFGQSEPIRQLAQAFYRGETPFDDSEAEFFFFLVVLARANMPEVDRALDGLCDSRHPRHRAVVQQLLDGNETYLPRWCAHPFCLPILRSALDDKKATGAEYRIQGNDVARRQENRDSTIPIPELLAKPDSRRNRAEERTCGVAALKLCDLIAGLPAYHPLLKDADVALAALSAAYDRFSGNYRRATPLEKLVLWEDSSQPGFVPDLHPLYRPATADDVAHGRAVFDLNGRGKLAPLTLPAVAILKRDAGADPPRMLIVQAEVGPDGIVYGLIGKHEVLTVAAKDVAKIMSMAELEKQLRSENKIGATVTIGNYR